MQQEAIERAAGALLSSRRGGPRPDALPDGAHPATVDEAHAVQDRVVEVLGEDVAGWKVALTPDGVSRGVVLRSRLRESPASLAGRGLPLLGVEAEIAFRFIRDLPPRERDYTSEEVAGATEAVVAIEVVGTRFRDYDAAPRLDKIADCMSNEAGVLGTRRPDWRDLDLASLEATLAVNDQVVVQRAGAHVTRDPFVPTVPLVNVLRRTSGVRAGQFITTGTFTGLHRSRPGDRIRVLFAEFGEASLTVTG